MTKIYVENHHMAKTNNKNAINGHIPNIKAFKAAIKELTKRIKLVSCKMQFACSDEEVMLAEAAVALLCGQRDAYVEVLDAINAKLRG